MSPVYLMMILAVLLIVSLIVGIWIYDHRADIRDIREVRRHARHREKLVIDYWRIDEVFQPNNVHKQAMRSAREWTMASDEALIGQGYLRAEKWMSELRYVGIPIYVRLHNFKIIDPTTLPKPNRLTSSVMFNVYHAQNMKRYISGLTKIQFAPMDLKSLGLLIPVIIGLAIGLLYFLGRM